MSGRRPSRAAARRLAHWLLGFVVLAGALLLVTLGWLALGLLLETATGGLCALDTAGWWHR